MIKAQREMIEIQRGLIGMLEAENARLREELDHLLCVTIPVLRRGLFGGKDQPVATRRSTASLVLVECDKSRQG
jgi:hypothetical protein